MGGRKISVKQTVSNNLIILLQFINMFLIKRNIQLYLLNLKMKLQSVNLFHLN